MAEPKIILLAVNIRLKCRRLETEITQTNPLVKQTDLEVPGGSASSSSIRLISWVNRYVCKRVIFSEPAV